MASKTTLDRAAGVFGNVGKKVLAACRTGSDKAGWELAYTAFQASPEFEKHYIPYGTNPPELCRAIEQFTPSSMMNAATSAYHQTQGEAARELASGAASAVALMPEGNGTDYEESNSGENAAPLDSFLGRLAKGAKSAATSVAKGAKSAATSVAEGAKSVAEGAKSAATETSIKMKKMLREKEVTQAANNAYNAYIDIVTQERGIRHHLRSIKNRGDVKKIETAQRELNAVAERLLAAKQAAENAAGEAEKIKIVAGIRRYRGGSRKTRKYRTPRKYRKQTRKH